MARFTHGHVKLVQMILVTVTGLIGIISVVLLSKVSSHFQDKCLLYAKMQVTRVAGGNVSLGVLSTWGEEETCNFTTFEGLVVFIASFVCFWFYLQMSILSQNSISQEAIFVVPRIFINTVLCFVSFVRAGLLTSGYSAFCDDISICTTIGRQQEERCRHSDGTCKELQTSKWNILPEQKAAIFHYDDYMHAAIALSWLEPVALAFNVAVVIAEVYILTSVDQSKETRSNRAFSFDSITGSQTALWVNDGKKNEGEGEEEEDKCDASGLPFAGDHRLEYSGSDSSSRGSPCGDTASLKTPLSGTGKSASLEKSSLSPRQWGESGTEPGGLARWPGHSQPPGQSGKVVMGPDDLVVHSPPHQLRDPAGVSAVVISPSMRHPGPENAQTNGQIDQRV